LQSSNRPSSPLTDRRGQLPHRTGPPPTRTTPVPRRSAPPSGRRTPLPDRRGPLPRRGGRRRAGEVHFRTGGVRSRTGGVHFDPGEGAAGLEGSAPGPRLSPHPVPSPLPRPSCASTCSAASLRKWAFRVLRLAPVSLSASRTVRRPCWQARVREGQSHGGFVCSGRLPKQLRDRVYRCAVAGGDHLRQQCIGL